MKQNIALGIVGATGLVGETFLKLLEQTPYEFSEIRLFASPKSQGQKISFRDGQCSIDILSDNCFENLDVVFFSSGDPISLEWAPKAVEQGAFAIDNSAAFRMNLSSPLVVPEINFSHIKNISEPCVIANPNCSTIQLVMLLAALKDFDLKQVRVASYQSVSGAGKEGLQDLREQTQDVLAGKTPRQGLNFNPSIAFECQPKIGSYDDDGFCSEERKIMNETKKILTLPDLQISAFTVRVPTRNGHGEAVWITFGNNVSKQQIEQRLNDTDFIDYLPMGGEKTFHSYDEVTGHTNAFVSRLRKDPDFPNTWMMWLVADNLYRGAAANGLLIAEKLFKQLD